MGRGRDEAGQSGAEYMALLLVLGAVIAAVATSDLGGRVAGGIDRAVCEITGGEGCRGGPEGGQAAAADDAPRPPDSGRAPRRIHDVACGDREDLPGAPIRETGQDPTGDEEADAVYSNLGQTYDYFRDTFGRDSFDADGGTLVASINLCDEEGRPVPNAFWNGEQMAFGDGYGVALDITAHELTHAVTERTADLDYECQPGALNEAMSDIFASNVDPEDWEIGEDLPTGALRDLRDPSKGHPPQPGHVDDFDTRPNDGEPFNDSGAVHYNSGIINRAYFLMVESIGRDAAERVVYKALTERLEEDSGFEDFRTAALESAVELYGPDGAQVAGVDGAFRAVGLDGTWVAPEVEGC